LLNYESIKLGFRALNNVGDMVPWQRYTESAMLGKMMGEVVCRVKNAMGAYILGIFLNGLKMVHYQVCLNLFPGIQWVKELQVCMWTYL